MYTGPLLQIKLHLLTTVILSGFQNSLAVPGKLHGSGETVNAIVDNQSSQVSWAWQIVLILKTGNIWSYVLYFFCSSYEYLTI